MTTPHVTETVPDSITAREPATIAHIVQRDRVLASILAVPDERRVPAGDPRVRAGRRLID